MRIGALLIGLAVWPVLGQTREDLLQTSVALTAALNRVNPPEETANKVRELMRGAMATGATSPGAGLYRLYAGFTLLSGIQWTPEVQFAAALRTQPRSFVMEPGQQIEIELTQLDKVEQWPQEKLKGEIYVQPLTPRDAPSTLLETVEGINGLTLPATMLARMPKDLAPGNYNLIVKVPLAQLAAKSGPGYNPTVKTMRVRVEAGLGAKFAALQERLQAARTKAASSPALDTVEVSVDLFDQARRGLRDVVRIDFAAELRASEEFLRAVEAGQDPLAGAKGALRRAYRSNVDAKVQPYRLLVPEGYDPAKGAPLVVALHGMGGNENDMIQGYSSVFVQEAQKRGFLMATPKGRGPASMYRGEAEQDVMDVLADVKKHYKVDEKRIYLTGHSMGGFGTWSIAMKYPEVWTALAPIAGGGNPQQVDTIAKIPQYVVHGDADGTVPVRSSRMMVDALKRVNAPVKYIEVPGGDHTQFVPAQIPALFEWLAQQVKP